MNKENEILVEIINICLSLDSKAYALYAKFAANCSNTSLAEEWRICAGEEKQHIQFWTKALTLANQGELPEIFDDPESIRSSLALTEEKTQNAISKLNDFDDAVETLTMAYRLESFMLDPSLMMMLESFGFINHKIEINYDEHINRFIAMLQKYGGNDSVSPLELLGETLGSLFRRNRELSRESTVDPLTKLLNRRGFFSNIKPFANLAKRKGESVAVIMADIDDFKKINDTLGHPKGDEVIAAVAGIISETIRKSDIAGRYGGEEFIVFLNVKDEQSLEVVCQRINEAVREKSLELSGVRTTISLGAASGKISGPEESAVALIINKADENLLTAKRDGKDRCVIS